MPSNHLILSCPLLLLPLIFPTIRIFSNKSVLHIRWPKDWSFSFGISPSNEYSGLISFRMDWLDLLTVPGTLKTLLHYQFKNISSFFFLPFIFISWRLITLQYCSGFCHTLTWISHGFTCVPHLNPPPTSLSTPSLWVFPVYQSPALVSCIPPGLVICFTLDNIHVSMLFSQNIKRILTWGAGRTWTYRETA